MFYFENTVHLIVLFIQEQLGLSAQSCLCLNVYNKWSDGHPLMHNHAISVDMLWS